MKNSLTTQQRFIIFFLCGFIIFSIIGCANSTNGKAPIARIPTKVTSYPLIDYKGVEHKYRDNFDSFVFPVFLAFFAIMFKSLLDNFSLPLISFMRLAVARNAPGFLTAP